MEFSLPAWCTSWTRKALDAYKAQWVEEFRNESLSFDWEEIFRRHRDPDRVEVAIWAGDRLSGLSLITTTSRAVVVNFLEGDARKDCPLKGKRIPIALELAASYGQLLGKIELRVQPANEKLESVYRNDYSFVREAPKGQIPYFRRAI